MRVVDERGVVRLALRDPIVTRTTGRRAREPHVRDAIEGATNFGDVGRALPALYLLRGGRRRRVRRLVERRAGRRRSPRKRRTAARPMSASRCSSSPREAYLVHAAADGPLVLRFARARPCSCCGRTRNRRSVRLTNQIKNPSHTIGKKPHTSGLPSLKIVNQAQAPRTPTATGMMYGPNGSCERALQLGMPFAQNRNRNRDQHECRQAFPCWSAIRGC